MPQRAGVVIFGIGELFLEDALPALVATFDTAPSAAAGDRLPKVRPRAGTSLRQLGPHYTSKLCAFQPTAYACCRGVLLGTLVERGHAGAEFVLCDGERGPPGLNPDDPPRRDQA